MTKIAIIGTAGRDKTIPMTHKLWEWMLDDVANRVTWEDHLISGGAAWADHLAVALFLSGKVKKLTLHLPAPFVSGQFVGMRGSAASAANWYHSKFSQVIQEDSLDQIFRAANMEYCTGTFEPAAPGYGGMFARNNKVAAAAEMMLAYTFSTGSIPADGGTKDTWDKTMGTRVHVSLPRL